MPTEKDGDLYGLRTAPVKKASMTPGDQRAAWWFFLGLAVGAVYGLVFVVGLWQGAGR